MAVSRARESESSPSYRVQVLDRAIDVLECFSFQRPELNLLEIVELTGLNRSTARRLVAILTRRGLLHEDSVTRSYRLGPRLFEMGGIVASSFSLKRAASQPIWGLGERLNATILLAAKSENRFAIVDKRESANMVWMPSEVGMSRALTHGPIGRVFMSGMDDVDVAELLERYPLEQSTQHSITDRDRFLAELARTSDLGYAMDIEEVVEGIMGIAAPIRDAAGEVVAALCIGLPATKQDDSEYIATATAHVKRACAEISRNLGYLDHGQGVGSGAGG